MPDSTLEATGPLWADEGIDFDNDGTLEISTGDGIYLNLFDQTWTFESRIWSVGYANAGWDHVQAITAIDANGNFESFGDGSMDNWGAGTVFPLNQDAYIAVEINLSGIIHYGWVRVMWNGTEFIYKDYAYNSTPGEAINAGQTTLAIAEYTNTMKVSYYPNPTKDYISIKTDHVIEEAHLINILGKITALNVSNNKINISSAPSGVYFLHVRAEKNNTIKKIIKL